MKAADVIQSFGVSTPAAKLHASKIVEIYKLLEKEKANIKDVVTKPVKDFAIGKYTHDKDDKKPKARSDDGTKVDGVSFNVTTTSGKYAVVVPDKTPIYYEFASLLGIEAVPEKQPSVKEEKPIMELSIGAGFTNAIKTAKTFTSKDFDLRPALGSILIEIEKDKNNKCKAKVVATDAHRLYMSPEFDVTMKKPGNYNLLIPAKQIPKDIGTGPVDILVGKNTVTLWADGKKTHLTTIDEKFPTYNVVVPKYKKGFVFNRMELISKVKEVIIYANKTTSQINLSITDHLELATQDIDYSQESHVRMPIVAKDMRDAIIGFSGKFLLDTLNAFTTENLTMLSDGYSNRCGIFTDGKTDILLMPLMLNSEVASSGDVVLPEKYSKPEGQKASVKVASMKMIAQSPVHETINDAQVPVKKPTNVTTTASKPREPRSPRIGGTHGPAWLNNCIVAGLGYNEWLPMWGKYDEFMKAKENNREDRIAKLEPQSRKAYEKYSKMKGGSVEQVEPVQVVVMEPKIPDFNEWFPSWPKAAAFAKYENSQGTGLKRAHSLMTQASRDYDKFVAREEKKRGIKSRNVSKEEVEYLYSLIKMEAAATDKK